MHPEGEALRVIMVFGAKQPAGLAVDEFEMGGRENWEDLVAIGIVGFLASIIAVDAVFVIGIEAVTLSWWAVFWEAIWIFDAGFSENSQLGFIGRLARFTQVSPETGFFHIVAATVVEISLGFVCNGDRTFFLGRAAHVGRSGGAWACALAKRQASNGDECQIQMQHDGIINGETDGWKIGLRHLLFEAAADFLDIRAGVEGGDAEIAFASRAEARAWGNDDLSFLEHFIKHLP